MYLYTQNSLIYRVLYIHSFIQLWIKVYVCRLVLFMAYLLKNNYKIGCQKWAVTISAILLQLNGDKIYTKLTHNTMQHHALDNYSAISLSFLFSTLSIMIHPARHEQYHLHHTILFLYNACHHEAFFCIWLLYSTRLQSECITI